MDEICLGNEPFRINTGAVENLPQREQIRILDFPLTHTARDTIQMMTLMWEHGCRHFITLGGDGTNRIAARHFPEATILPLSTGTNNVFPWMLEASVAGAAAGLIASDKLDAETHCRRCKQIHVEVNGETDNALVDAVLLREKLLGNLLPYDTDNILEVFLTRAEPASIGVSPIGGYLSPCHESDDFGLHIECGEPAKARVRVPISAGLYGDVAIRDFTRVSPGEVRIIEGPGILAFDGDRSIRVETGDEVRIRIERDGPRIMDARAIMDAAARAGILARSL
ncbi:MAG: NAD(+)/NADH kinase [Pseudomonadales bacterium]|nr:NAD(+)/NADH kinase [Pseudomonadales bacterium]